METTSVAFEIRVRIEFQLLNELYKNFVTSLSLKFIYNRKKSIEEIGSLPGCDSLSLKKVLSASSKLLSAFIIRVKPSSNIKMKSKVKAL
jgi:hypothetical protein